MSYFVLKYMHILGAALLFGTGLGIAFFMFVAVRLGESAGVALIARIVVIADYVFTLVAALLQPLSGSLLVFEVGYEFTDFWVWVSLLLYGIIGICWVPVVFMQKEMRDLAVVAANEGAPLPGRFYQLYKRWFLLGWPAFISMLLIFLLMIVRPASFTEILPF